jgi:serine/threonine-protein phosphatase 2B catalytic subunit
MTEMFSFRNEVIDKLGCVDMYERYMECFDHLPIAADVNGGKAGNYLCMHGGISPYMRSKLDIDKIDRFSEPPMDGIFCDLLWSDPASDSRAMRKTFVHNEPRQCSFEFGLQPVKRLLAEGGYNSIVRAH